jgi:DNA-binding MarR family transcriptional regulator
MTIILEKKLTQNLLEFYEKMASWEHSVVKDSDISHTQMHAIEIIGHHKSLKMNELAKIMGVTTGTITVMIDRLEQNKLVKRKPHKTDRRAYLLVLTEKGLKYYKEHLNLHLKLTQEIIVSLDEKDITNFNSILEKINDIF